MSTQANAKPMAAAINEDAAEGLLAYNQIRESNCAQDDRSNVDGAAIYRGTARQVMGDPEFYKEVRDHVQRFAMRAGLHDHPLHARFKTEEQAYADEENRSLFAGLECPDVTPNEHLFWVVARALKIRVKVYESVDDTGKLGKTIIDAGQHGLPVCRLLRLRNGFASLVQDQSGKALIQYLQEKQKASKQDANALPVKHIAWTWKSTDHAWGLACYNEHRFGSKLSDLSLNAGLNRMDVFSVVISDPLQVKPALELLREVLLRAPNQRCIARSSSGRQRVARPHIATDLEFVKIPLERASGPCNVDEALASGDLDEIVSVMSIAVGRHFSLMFNISQMLENANEHTVEALATLYRETIFDPELNKLWWNPQRDLELLDRTIEYMYQGTETTPAACEEGEGGEDSNEAVTTQPCKFHITGTHLNGIRPADLKQYTKLTQCELHRAVEDDGYSADGGGCPCAFGNIDLAALLDSFCRQHGLNSHKKHWTTVRRNFRYGDLLTTMLATDRLAPLLQHLKDCGRGFAFYQSFAVSGMEEDDRALGYNIGDVAGSNLVYEQLMALQDKRFVARSLYLYRNYSNKDQDVSRNTRELLYEPEPRAVAQRSVGECSGVPLYEDNPTEYQLKPFSCNPHKDRLLKTFTRPRAGGGLSVPDENLVSLAFWEHDQRALKMRQLSGKSKIFPARKALYRSFSRYSAEGMAWEDRIAELSQKVHRHDLNPTRLALPETMLVNPPDEEYQDPIVRAGSTHAEGLVELLHSGSYMGVTSPSGFAAAPGTQHGLPGSAWQEGRTPGQDMCGGAAIFNAFTAHPRGTDVKLLTDHDTVERLAVPPAGMTLRINGESIFQALLKATGHYDDHWKAAGVALRSAKLDVKTEVDRNVSEGWPYLVDECDALDPEGRIYRRMIEAAEPWNRPVLHEYYLTGPGGEWLSKAIIGLIVLQQELPDNALRELEALDSVERVVDEWGDSHDVVYVDQWMLVEARGRRRG